MEQDVHALGLLFELQRRRVYDDVQAHPGRSVADICETLSLGRSLITFHLGKLIEGGFIEPAPAARDEGFVGRPPRHCRTTSRTVSASVPERQYELLASVLLDAAVEPTGLGHKAALVAAARRHGAALAARLKTSGRGRRSRSIATALASVDALLLRARLRPGADNCCVVIEPA